MVVGCWLLVISCWLLVVEITIAQVREAFFTPLQVAERVGVEPTIRV